MRLAIYSDLHLENGDWAPPPLDVDAVLLAGDIANGTDGVSWAASTFNAPVLYVLGNHEFYGHDYEGLRHRIRDNAQDGVTVLDRGVYHAWDRHRPVRILGCTLWTDFGVAARLGMDRELAMDRARGRSGDYREIHAAGRTVQPADTVRWHAADRGWLCDELNRPFPGATVVVTHHAPAMASAHPLHPRDSFTPFFIADLEDLIRRTSPDLWVHGHTHSCADYRVGRTRIVSNQRRNPARGGARGGARPETSPAVLPFQDALVIEI